MNLNYIDINPSLLFQVKEKFEILAGLYTGYLINGKTKVKSESSTIKTKVKTSKISGKWGFGLNAGTTFSLTNEISLDINYKLGFNEVETIELTNNGLSVGGRIMF